MPASVDVEPMRYNTRDLFDRVRKIEKGRLWEQCNQGFYLSRCCGFEIILLLFFVKHCHGASLVEWHRPESHTENIALDLVHSFGENNPIVWFRQTQLVRLLSNNNTKNAPFKQ